MAEQVYSVTVAELAALATRLVELDDARLVLEATADPQARAAARRIGEAAFAVNDILHEIVARGVWSRG